MAHDVISLIKSFTEPGDIANQFNKYSVDRSKLLLPKNVNNLS